jgi:protein HOOK3
LTTRHEEFNIRHDELKEAFAQKDSQLRSLQDLQDGNQEGVIKGLQIQVGENENLIAQQEHQLEEFRIFKERQQRDLNALRPAATRLKELEDEFHVIKTENESLTKKANMVDHYRGKLESLNAIDRENKALRERVDILQENQNEYDQVHAENEKLKNMKEEYEKLLSNQEGDIQNLTSTSKMYKEVARAKQIEIDDLKARQTADESFIEDLQNQLRSGTNAPQSPGSPDGGATSLTLEDELEAASDPSSNYLVEVQRLKAENSLLKSGNVGASTATLRVDLEESERARQRLSETLRELTDQNTIISSQLAALLSTSSDEK